MNRRAFFMTLGLMFILLPHLLAQNRAGVELEHDSTASITAVAGSRIVFALHALNEQGGTVADWNTLGRDVTLAVKGSHALTDSSVRAWDADPEGYSWLRIALNDSALALDSIGSGTAAGQLFYTIPRSAFTDGRASLAFTQSAADTGVVISLSPAWNFLRQSSPPIRILPLAHDNYLVDLTSAVPDSEAVFLQRLYEFVVIPRDRFLNTLDDGDIPTELTARFPDEFGDIPGATGKLPGTVAINGVTPVSLASTVSRGDTNGAELQWIRVQRTSDSTVSGLSDPYAVLDHAPYPFQLITPPDQFGYGVTQGAVKLSWSGDSIPDPYSKIQVSRFDSTMFVSDSVLYRVFIFQRDSMNLLFTFLSDDSGRSNILTLTDDTLWTLWTGHYNRTIELLWYVEATDGLFVTQSRPPNNDVPQRPGFRLYIWNYLDDVSFPSRPSATPLSPNYPNPFNPSTTIPIALEQTGHVRLRVLNLLGEEVALLHDGSLPAGEHRFRFDGVGLPSGMYRCQLEMNGRVVSRSMMLLR